MNLQSPTPSSGPGRTTRNAPRRSAGIPYMSERQIQAYLLARDALRRIQRSTSLVDGAVQRAASDCNRIAHGRRRNG